MRTNGFQSAMIGAALLQNNFAKSGALLTQKAGFSGTPASTGKQSFSGQTKTYALGDVFGEANSRSNQTMPSSCNINIDSPGIQSSGLAEISKNIDTLSKKLSQLETGQTTSSATQITSPSACLSTMVKDVAALQKRVIQLEKNQPINGENSTKPNTSSRPHNAKQLQQVVSALAERLNRLQNNSTGLNGV